jgi:hypothetical protein
MVFVFFPPPKKLYFTYFDGLQIYILYDLILYLNYKMLNFVIYFCLFVITASLFDYSW